MKTISEIKSRLLEIKDEFEGFGNFSIHTMSKVEKRAREVKVFVVDTLGRDNEIFREMDSCIEISEGYHRNHQGLDYNIIRNAMRHLEYGLDLFIQRI